MVSFVTALPLGVGGCGDDAARFITKPSGPVASHSATAFGTSGQLPHGVDGGGSPGRTNDEPESSDPGHEQDANVVDGTPCEECDASTATSTPPAQTDGDGSVSPSPTTDETADASGGLPTDPASQKWLEGQPLFAHDGIAEVRLQIPTEGIDALNADSATYVAGSLNVVLTNGTEVALNDVGMRLKGQWGSARTLDQKAGFLLKMNEFVPDQKLLGLNKLALNNMVQDASMIHEQLAYALFREMGGAAPRTAYARVTLNDELMGLYATVEVVDNASFLDHWFGNDNGNLYEGAYGSDLEYDLIETFDQDRGPELAFSDLYELSAALDGMVEPSTFVTDVDSWIELDAYARFAATELFLGHWDGYAATRNNYFLYRAPGAKWTFLPWGLDQTFYDTNYSIFDGNGRVQGLCAASLVCREKLGAAYEELIELVGEMELQQRIDELEALISDAVDEDPRKETDSETFHATVEETREFLRVRPGVAQGQLICTNPANVDADEDGASGCGADCNDSDPARYPGATETCNFIDDDCNGLIDEPEECDSCMEHARNGGGTYLFCFGPSSYAEAWEDCRDRGGELASIHSEEEQAEIDATTQGIGLNEWWIGLSDREEEGEFRWEDASPFDFLHWSDGEPNDAGENEDCAHLTGWGGWNDNNCDVAFGYICQLD